MASTENDKAFFLCDWFKETICIFFLSKNRLVRKIFFCLLYNFSF